MRNSKREYPCNQIKAFKTEFLIQNTKKTKDNHTIKKPIKKRSFVDIRSSSSEVIKTRTNFGAKMRSNNITPFENKELSSDNEDDDIIENSFGEEEPISKPQTNNTKTFFMHRFKDKTLDRTKIISYKMNITLKPKSPDYKFIQLKKINKSQEEKTNISPIPRFNSNLQNPKHNKFVTINNRKNMINSNDKVITLNLGRKKEENNNIGNYYHCRNCMIVIAVNKNNSKFYINN